MTVLACDAEGGFAADGITHCVRPTDMTGKSAVVLLRRVFPNLVHEAIDVRVACADTVALAWH